MVCIKKINTKNLCFIFSIYILISFIIIIYFSSHCTNSFEQNDGFDLITTNLKIKFVQDKENRHIYNDSVELCQKLNAVLWDVWDEEEWNIVLEYIKSNYSEQFDYGIWLNGKAVEKCSGSNDECEEIEHQEREVLVEWSNYRRSNFSRLENKNWDHECIMFSSKDEAIWKSVDCVNSYYWALCIKRKI